MGAKAATGTLGFAAKAQLPTRIRLLAAG